MDPEFRLSLEQCRVLGVLIEKSLTTPDAYPLTLNAVVLGCNQKQNREPVVEFEESDVGRVVHELMQLQLVRLSALPSSARSNRFEHMAEERLNWPRSQQAIMAELLLRGPQTVGELRSRAGRMARFPDLASVSRVLDELSSREPPHVRALAREPGRSAIRHAHQLCADGEGTTPAAPPTDSASTQDASGTPASALDPNLHARIARLESQVLDLERRIAALRAGDAEPR